MDPRILIGIIVFCILFFIMRRSRRARARTQTAAPARTQQEEHPAQQPTAHEEHGGNRQREPYHLTFSLTPGVETFTPEPLPNGQLFKITFTGTYTCEVWNTAGGFISDRVIGHADTCFETQLSLNFTHHYRQLVFDSSPVTAEPFEEDRMRHQYSFSYMGRGRELSILLDPPETYSRPERDWARHIKGTLAVSVRPLAPQEQAVITARAAVKNEARERPAREKEEQQTRERAEKIQTRVMELTHLAEAQPHYADPKHLEDYTRKNKDTLLRRCDEITKKYLADREVISHLKEHAPQLVAFATWEMRALTAAEQLDAQQPPAPPIEEKKLERPKLTPEQFTERMVKHFTTKLKDQEVILKAGRAWLDAQEEEILANIEDEDERENVRQHLQAILGEALQTLNQNRKGG